MSTIGGEDSKRQRRSKPKMSSSSSLSSSSSQLSSAILDGLHDRADTRTKEWFTNYVKGTTWIGCKTPVVRDVIKKILRESKATQNKATITQGKKKKRKTSSNNDDSNTVSTRISDDGTSSFVATPSVIMDSAMTLFQHEASDAKMAGILLLSEQYPMDDLATMSTLDEFDTKIWSNNNAINDWSTCDWFSTKVLSKIVFNTQIPDTDRHMLQRRILEYARQPNNTLWHRRCGIVPFLQYHKKRELCLDDIGSEVLRSCEENLLVSPNERFTQTGIGWVLRYVLQLKKSHPDGQAAMDFVVRHGSVWTIETKKSFCEKLSKSDPWKKTIMKLGE